MTPELIKLDDNTILDRSIKGQWERIADGSVGLDDYQGKGFIVIFRHDQATRLWNELCKACGKGDPFPKPSVEPVRNEMVFDSIRAESRATDPEEEEPNWRDRLVRFPDI